VGTFSEQTLGKVSDFCLVGELGVLVAAGSDNQLKVFLVDSSKPDGLSLTFNSNLVKESAHRALQIHYDRKRGLLFCLSSDNKMEAFKVNTDRPDSILKKLLKKEKKSNKRTHSEMEAATET
jgi:U3 small nucleolar RNA-associated protein 12